MALHPVAAVFAIGILYRFGLPALRMAKPIAAMTSVIRVKVALRLLTDRDFDSLTMDQIASAAGISRRTFFRYFTSKEDVVYVTSG